MTERYAKELFGQKCGELIDLIDELLKFPLLDWQQHRLFVLKGEIVGTDNAISEQASNEGRGE